MGYPDVFLQAGAGHRHIGHGHVVHWILSSRDAALGLHTVQDHLWPNNPAAELRQRHRKQKHRENSRWSKEGSPRPGMLRKAGRAPGLLRFSCQLHVFSALLVGSLWPQQKQQMPQPTCQRIPASLPLSAGQFLASQTKSRYSGGESQCSNSRTDHTIHFSTCFKITLMLC